MYKKITFFVLLATILTSCKVTVQPMYVSSVELAGLRIGMTKQEVKTKLTNLAPFDVLFSQQNGCEIHQYKYKTPAKKTDPKQVESQSGLTDGQKQYVKESDAYLIYKDGKLESVLSNVGKEDALNILDQIDAMSSACNQEGLRGCTDPQSLIYNPNAIIDDGSCKYCPCGFFPNPNFNPNRPIDDCNQQCLKIEVIVKEDENDDDKPCTNCDIIDKLSNSKANVSIQLNLPNEQQKQKGIKTSVKGKGASAKKDKDSKEKTSKEKAAKGMGFFSKKLKNK